jgi:hypothetical protein
VCVCVCVRVCVCLCVCVCVCVCVCDYSDTVNCAVRTLSKLGERSMDADYFLIDTEEENRSTRRNLSQNTLFATNFTWTGLGSIPDLQCGTV